MLADVEIDRQHQNEKRLQLENELEEAQALTATNVLEQTKARLIGLCVELEKLGDGN